MVFHAESIPYSVVGYSPTLVRMHTGFFLFDLAEIRVFAVDVVRLLFAGGPHLQRRVPSSSIQQEPTRTVLPQALVFYGQRDIPIVTL